LSQFLDKGVFLIALLRDHSTLTTINHSSPNQCVRNIVREVVINRHHCNCSHYLKIENGKKLRITKDTESDLDCTLKANTPLLSRHRRINCSESLPGKMLNKKIALTAVFMSLVRANWWSSVIRFMIAIFAEPHTNLL